MEHLEKCKWCGGEGPHPVTLTPETQNYARVDCCNCNRWLRWLPKPQDDPTKYKRPAAERELVRKFGQGFCELCLTREGDLPDGRVLEGHHIREFQDGGKADATNVLILCTGCHKLVHWVRTYRGGVASIGEVLSEWPA